MPLFLYLDWVEKPPLVGDCLESEWGGRPSLSFTEHFLKTTHRWLLRILRIDKAPSFDINQW